MRIFLALSVIIISIKYGTCRIDLKHDKDVIIDIDSPELHQSQYHTADFNTSAYNYGYEVNPNGQFHHETRGADGVTYGCYGYIDTDDLLKVTHYVADSQGYRTLEHEKPVLVYPIDENFVNADEKPYKPKGVMLDWKDLYFPIGCGMAKGGVLLNAPVIRAPGGQFQQLGETKYPVPPSNEPKVIIPRIPFNSGIKIEPTKLIPISRVPSNNNKQNEPTVSSIFSSTGSTQTSTNKPSISTKISYDVNVNGPDYENRNSNRPSQYSVQPLPTFTDNPNRFVKTLAPSFRDTVKSSRPTTVSSEFLSPVVTTNSEPFQRPTTVKTTDDNFKFNKISSPIIPSNSEGVYGQYDNNEGLLPPFSTTFDDRQTTISVPFNSINADNDLNVINSYSNLNPESRTTTQSGYVEEITTTVPIPSQVFSNRNTNRPYTFPSYKQQDSISTEKINTNRPNKFDAFNFHSQTTTDIPIEFVTEQNPESTIILTTEIEPNSTPFGEIPAHTEKSPKDTNYPTAFKFNSIKHDTTGYGISSSGSIASQPPIEISTLPNAVLETSSIQSTYPGIGDYKKPQVGFEFNIPTRAPIQVSTENPQTFVTDNNVETVNDDAVDSKDLGGAYYEGNKDPNYENVQKNNKFTNGPHGAEYQLSSRTPHSQFTVGNGRVNDYNFREPIKQSRKGTDAKDPQITPLTHLSMADSFPLKDEVPVSSKTDNFPNVPYQFVNGQFTDSQPSTTPTYRISFNGFDPSSQLKDNQNAIQTEIDNNRRRPQQPLDFFTVTTPKNEPSVGIITHMNAISQTRFQSSRVTPSILPVSPNDQPKSNELNFNSPANYYTPEVPQTNRPDVRLTENPFLYTRSRTAFSITENSPYQRESTKSDITKTPSEDLGIYSGSFGQRIQPEPNLATTSFTAYNPGSTSRPVTDNDLITPSTDSGRYRPVSLDNSSPHQPKFVLRPIGRQAANTNGQPNGYYDTENKNANFYPDSPQQRAIALNDNNKIQSENKYVNTKKEFIPPYNPNSTPIPGSLGTAIGVYPPNLDELSPEIPNFNIAISKWPFYILPFPFTNGNIMSLPFIPGMPIQLGNGNNIPLANINYANQYAPQVPGSIDSSGNGKPGQSICSWLSSFIQPKVNTTTAETAATTPDGETLQISNLQVNIKNPQLQFNQNEIPFGIVGFIPIIAVPNCQHNVNGDKSEAAALPSIQIPSLCSQLTHLIGSQINAKDTNQPLPT
jgi:hypothetical protein